MLSRWLSSLCVVAVLALPAWSADAKKRLLLVTDSGGFVHDSVGVAEEILKKIGPDNGFTVECYRFTRDPDQMTTASRTVKGDDGKPMKGKDGKEVKEQYKTTALAGYSEAFRARTGMPVEKENCGRVNAATLKNFDCVLFFTTGNPLNEQEVKDLSDWVKAGGAIAGTHCGTDTLYPSKERPWNAAYGELIGAVLRWPPVERQNKSKG